MLAVTPRPDQHFSPLKTRTKQSYHNIFEITMPKRLKPTAKTKPMST